jgi:hypothetical protein
MPVFEVKRRVDAYVDYYAKVEADSPSEAAQLACDDPADYVWEKDQTQEFDARLYITLDAEGLEIEETEVRDF